MASVSLGTHVLMPTEKTNFKRKPTCQATSKQKCAHSFTLKDIAHTERGANFCIQSMTSSIRSASIILQESKNAQDWLSKGQNRLITNRPELRFNISTSSRVVEAVPPSQDSQCSKKYTTKTITLLKDSIETSKNNKAWDTTTNRAIPDIRTSSA